MASQTRCNLCATSQFCDSPAEKKRNIVVICSSFTSPILPILPSENFFLAHRHEVDITGGEPCGDAAEANAARGRFTSSPDAPGNPSSPLAYRPSTCSIPGPLAVEGSKHAVGFPGRREPLAPAVGRLVWRTNTAYALRTVNAPNAAACNGQGYPLDQTRRTHNAAP